MLNDYKILINEVIPFLKALYEKEKPYSYDYSRMSQMIVTLNTDGNLTGYIDSNNFCKRNIKSTVKIFRCIDIPEVQEKTIRGYDCCGYEKMTDNDIPENWKKLITLNTDIDSLLVYSAG
jgi:hypothetical protein